MEARDVDKIVCDWFEIDNYITGLILSENTSGKTLTPSQYPKSMVRSSYEKKEAKQDL
jgi:hypothetical protein